MAKRKLDGDVPLILDGTFYLVQTVSDGSVLAKCTSCSGSFKGTFRSTSNFITHLRLKHPDKLAEFEKYKVKGPIVKRQNVLGFPVIETTSTFQDRANKLVIDFIVHTMSPISMVENVHFRNLINGFPSTSKVPCAATFMKRVEENFKSLKNRIVQTLYKLTWVSITADIWSAHHRSFLGVTCHWIDENFNRRSCVLTLKRFIGHHNAIEIMKTLCHVFKEFGISDKIVAVVTDNGTNFVKAFKEYGLRPKLNSPLPGEEEEHELDSVLSQDDLTTMIDDEPYHSLPSHVRCASHTLSLVATTDLEKELEKRVSRQDKSKTTCKRIMRSTFAKCTAFWTKGSRSVVVAEKLKAEMGTCLITPCKTRWNSMFDSVKQLVDHIEKLDTLFELADVEKLKPHEKEFLRGYESGLQPVAWALDTLQKENRMFYGYLAPVILKAEKKLTEIVAGDSEFAGYVASSLLAGLSNRFKNVLELDLTARSEILGAITIPRLKMNWINDDSKKDILKKLLIDEAKTIITNELPMTSSSVSLMEKKKIDEDDDLFDFENETGAGSKYFEDAELECIRYLKDAATAMESLKSYKRIMALFEKYNTILPSSAPAERLFSYGKMILRSQRARLSDANFEYFVFLKLNASHDS